MNIRKKDIYMVLVMFCLNLTVFAQNISLNLNNVTVKKAIETLKETNGYSFVFASGDIDTRKTISIAATDKPISEVVKQILNDQTLSFEIKGKNIIVKKGTDTNLPDDKKQRISGVITDANGEPVIGANVIESGTVNGTITDLNGKYSLEVSPNSTLQITYVGYDTQEIKIGGQTTINIELKEDSQALEEVIVVGYGVQKKVNLTGAVSQVSSKVLENRPITNLSQGLQGVVPNLNINNSDGNPNSTAKMNIRGAATISDDATSPLILVDGVQMTHFNMLNPEDIESISVLKDASSAAIYGARGAFGVILITTKGGKANTKPVIEYSGSIQFNTHTYLPDMLSAVDYMDASNESSFNNSGKNKYTDEQVQWVKDYNADPVNNPIYHVLDNGKIFWNGGNDNYTQMLSKWSPTHKHTVSVNGGSEKINFYASAGMMHQDGMFKDYTDVFKRYNFLTNVSAKLVENFRLGFKATYSQTIYDEPHRYTTKGSSWWEQMTRGEPQILYPIYTPEDSPVGGGIPTEHFYNFLASGSRNNTKREDATFLINGEWDIIKGLKLKGDFSYRTTNYRNKDIQKEFSYIRDSWTTQNSATYPSFISDENRHTDYFAGNIFMDYTTNINQKHNIYALIGFNQEWELYRMSSIKKENLVSMEVPSINLGTGNIIGKDSEQAWAIRGAFMRFKYDYKGKYLFEMNGRYDGTSKFPHSSRFGFFPSFAGGWRISEENFMSSTRNWLNDLKVRVNYGSLGNQNVSGVYPYISTFDVTQQTQYILNGNLPISVTAPGLVASDLTWETVKTLNLGVDITLLNKLSASFDWFDRRTINMLTEGDKLPSILGTDSPRRNNANMKTNGWEVSLRWQDALNNGINYDVSLILSDYVSKITKYDNNPSKLYETYYVGKTIGEIWGYETVGIFQSKEEVAASADQSQLGNGSKWGPGDVHYADLNGDKVINWGDKTVDNPGDTKIIGNTTPRYQFGITGNIAWKGFDLNIFIQGVGKRDFFPSGNFFWGQINNAGAVGTYEVYNNAWREDTPNALYPIWKAGSAGYNAKTQTRFLQSGAYARLKNLTLGYTLPNALTSKLYLNRLRVYFSGQNLCEITNIKGGFDPEIIGNVGEYYPLQRSILLGLQITL